MWLERKIANNNINDDDDDDDDDNNNTNNNRQMQIFLNVSANFYEQHYCHITLLRQKLPFQETDFCTARNKRYHLKYAKAPPPPPIMWRGESIHGR
jgi:hypothetical protein